jgi:two-component system, OmpR family, sensor histidine kinase CpxA
MRSLFVKILLWFGLAMVLVNIASFATGILTERRFQPPRNHPFATTMSLFGETAAGIYERDGTFALHSYLDRIERVSSISTVLFDESGRELSGRAVSENARTLASRPAAIAPFVVDPPVPFTFGARPLRSSLAAQLVTSAQGSKFILVGELPQGFPGPPRIGEPGSLWFGLRILARTLLPLLLIGGLFCYLLARYLAQPIVKLRSTTRELSGGNLSARVDPGLLKRRDEIGYLGRDFNFMATHIESLVDAQRRLLTDISHELRSPLARQGVALGLARRRANAEVGPSLDRIGREAERMNQMIGQLLDLSRVENGTDTLQVSRIDLTSLVDEIVQDADYEALDRERAVRVTARDKCSINGVVDLLSSAIENVVRNAVRHTNPNTSVEIGLRCSDLNGQRSATITVRDHGRGVPESSLDEIFQPFYRVEEARDRKSGGTGLGLAIAARAVRLHSGTIKASNAAEGGLVVEIILPVTREVTSGKPAARA